jgi:hypothetical protein
MIDLEVERSRNQNIQLVYFIIFFVRPIFLNLNHSLISARSSFINAVPTPARMPNAAVGIGTFPKSKEDSDNRAPISP